MALKPGMGKEAESDEEEAPESKPGKGEDYKKIAIEAAEEGDWSAMVDAICSYKA